MQPGVQLLQDPRPAQTGDGSGRSRPLSGARHCPVLTRHESRDLQGRSTGQRLDLPGIAAQLQALHQSLELPEPLNEGRVRM